MSQKFKTDYATNKIDTEDWRMGPMVQSDKFDGSFPLWHHAKCYMKIPSIAQVEGFDKLKWDDQVKLRAYTGEGGAVTSAPKEEVKTKGRGKRKADADETEDKKPKAMSELEIAVMEQTKQLWVIKNGLKTNCTTAELREMLEFNNRSSKGGEQTLIDRAADGMMFGRIGPCPTCKGDEVSYESQMYVCHSHMSEWSHCTFRGPSVRRLLWKIPKDSENEFLTEWAEKNKRQPRPVPVHLEVPAVKTILFPNMVFVFVPDSEFSKDIEELKKLIEENGGKVQATVTAKVNYVLCGKDDDLKTSKQVKAALKNGLPIVTDKFILDSVEKGRLAEFKHFKTWPEDAEPTTSGDAKRVGEPLAGGRVVKLVKKGRSVVDPLSKLQDTCHILEEGSTIYNVMLNATDVTKGTNSFYGLQLIENDSCNHYYVFMKWGRVGTEIGASKVEDCSSKADAKRVFMDKYFEKTGNYFSERNEFKKQKGKFYPVAIDYGDDDMDTSAASDVNSKLDPRVFDVVSMIFDVKNMKSTLMELEIDLEKMPLGKLSKETINEGFAVLKDVAELLTKKKSKARDIKLMDKTNQFYTVIPHAFGDSAPPPLDSDDQVKAKTAMLEALMDIEIATKMMKAAGDVGGAVQHPVDSKYDQLKTKMVPVEHNTEEFQRVVKYIHNTHGRTHKDFTLELEELFAIEREGEYDRFAPSKSMHNRQLLWHGSGTANYGGILSQGLRIAPPEAPVTGYMFGKGVYFADMVSKSANYCRTSRQNPMGLMLLSDVALGDMYELYGAEYMEKAPPGTQSTKGCGRYGPNPDDVYQHPDGYTIPYGKDSDAKLPKATTLLYNEFIVYDVKQINMKYLLKLRFNYKK